MTQRPVRIRVAMLLAAAVLAGCSTATAAEPSAERVTGRVLVDCPEGIEGAAVLHGADGVSHRLPTCPLRPGAGLDGTGTG